MGDTYGDNPVHPIIDKPSQFDLVRFDIHCDPEKPRAAYLDLWLRRGTELRCLRFTQPSSINIKDGFRQRCSGMVILDVRHWGWEDVVSPSEILRTPTAASPLTLKMFRS